MSPLNDVTIMALASNAFWLIVIVILMWACVFAFRNEIKGLISSIVSVNIAGNRFELGDKERTNKSYLMLSTIFFDMLCNGSKTGELCDLISDTNSHQLYEFALQYIDDVPPEKSDVRLIRNVAKITSLRAYDTGESIRLHESILKKFPNEHWARADYGYALKEVNPVKAKQDYDKLLKDFPAYHQYRFNRAVISIVLRDFDEAFKDLSDWLKWLKHQKEMQTGRAGEQLINQIKEDSTAYWFKRFFEGCSPEQREKLKKEYKELIISHKQEHQQST